jgi:large subunit ribosomal protein L10
MINKKIIKSALIQEVKSKYDNSECVVFLNYTGVTAATMHNLRLELRKAGQLKFQVLKNTLNKIALNSTEFVQASESLKGQIGIVVCNDVVAVAKIVDKFCNRDKKLQFVGFFIPKQCYNIDYVLQIANLPSMDALRAQLLATMNSVGSSLLALLVEPANSLARLATAYTKK